MLGLRASPFKRSVSSTSTKPSESEVMPGSPHTNDLTVMKRQQELTNGYRSEAPMSNGNHIHINGHSNGYISETSSSSGSFITFIRDIVAERRSKIIADFEYIDAALLDRMTIGGFSDYITRERLGSMPHRGSLWDRVLRWAEFYALQVSAYSESIGAFVPEARSAANQIFTLLRSLLELGEENADALNTTFGVFYKLGLSLSFLTSHKTKLGLNGHVKEDVGRAFHDIHTLVYKVAKYYESSVRGLSSGSTTLDFNSLFKHDLDSFYRHKDSIINHLWRHSLGGSGAQDVQATRRWLNQRSYLLKAISADRNTYRSKWDEFTCEWFSRHLLEFTRSDKDVLAITAPAGCGKTVLSSWILERLQRPMDRKTHSTVYFSFEADIPRETTSLALAKSIALQLMDVRVGNLKMYNHIKEASKQTDAMTIESQLWKAIDLAFDSSDEPTMIIIDGLDQLKGGDVSRIVKIVTDLSCKHRALRSIILSRPSPALTTANQHTQSFQIKADDVYDDIHHIATHALQSCEQYMALKETERIRVTDQLVKTARGCFLWLSLVTRTLSRSKTLDEFNKGVYEAPGTLDEAVKRLAGFMASADNDSKLLLSILLVAERPLSISELYSVLQVDTKRGTNTMRHIDVAGLVTRMNGLVVVSDAQVVRFRHSFVRAYFATLAREHKIASLEEAQKELLQRLLAYGKACLKKHDICLESLSYSEVDQIYRDHALLEYMVRNWLVHFRQTSLHKTQGAFGFSADFKALFPSSSYLVLLEWTCWDEQTSRHEMIDMHSLSLRIRTEVFEEKHECTLQNVIACGFIHQEYTSATDAAKYFYRASHIGQAILQKFSKITISLTQLFLTITETIKYTSRTEIVTYREEMLKFIIIVHKHEHGETSDIVIRYYKALAELYVCIHEEEHATEIWQELRIIIIKKHGEGSEAEREISGKLMIVLKGKKDFEIEHYRDDIFAINEEIDIIWDAARIRIYLELALTCEHKKEWYEAEEIYITLWTRLLHLCRHQHSHDIEFRICVLKVAIEYAHFLHRRHRHEEAKNILIIIWTEHQHFGCESVAFYLQLKIIGQMMRTLSLLTVAVSIFQKIVSWFIATGKHDHEEVRHCEGYILEIVEEITKKETFHKEETTEETETVIRRMFNSTTVVNEEYIKITRTAVSLYVKKELWSEAITVLTKCLSLMWTESSWGGEVCLPHKFADEAIEFAIELGRCHMRCKHYHESLSCYIQLWQAVRSSCGFHDKRRKLIVDVLIGFYTEHKRWRLLIELHRELLIEYRRHHGKAHHLTIELLYVIGDLIHEHGHGYAADYYREIIEVCTDFKISFRAYRVLCQIYYDECHWLELKGVCDILWKYLIHHHKEHSFTAEFVEMLYIRFIYVLRHHHKCDHKFRVSIALQFKEICVLIFGSSSSISVRARLEYASILIEHESTKTEAISVYEEIITISKTSKTTVIDESSLTIVKKHLTEVYTHAHHHGTCTTEMLERAVIVLQERFEHLKITLGISHKQTLTIFAELIGLRFKLKDEKTIIKHLREVVIEIVSKEKRSEQLFEAAGIVGNIYIICGLHAHGLELMREIRRQVVSAHTHGSKDTFKIDKSVTRISFVFLVGFELTLKGTVSHSYSEIMADYLSETVLYESYHRCLTTTTKIDILLTRSAHLRAFWALHGHKEEIARLDQQVFEVFFRQFGKVVKTREEMVKVFLVSILIHMGARETTNVQISTVASVAGNKKVLALLKEGKYQEAHEVGHCTFHFVMSQGGYHKVGLVGYGFKLAGYMAGREAGAIPGDIRAKMLQTSREIMAEVLHACKALEVNFLHLHDHELNELVELLGDQENYKELEIILESLWKTRNGQKHWSEDTLINLAKLLISSRFLADKDGHCHSAIHLAEDVKYNLSRTLGGLHPHTLAISELLSQLYTSAKHYADAINVHEEILQLIVSGDDGDDRTPDEVRPRIAKKHLDLLKAAYQRNEGWVKSKTTYERLVESLLSMREFKNSPEFQNVQPLQKWIAKKEEASSNVGVFMKPVDWELIVPNDVRIVNGVGKHVHAKGGSNGTKALPEPKPQRPTGWSLRRISENWGISFG